MTVVFVDRANACQNFDNYWWKIQNWTKISSKNKFLWFWDNSGFWFCDIILGFGVNSGFRFFGTILGFWVQGFGFLTRFWGLGSRVWVLRHDFRVWGSGFSFFDTILGFGVLVFSHHIRVWGFGVFTQN